MAASASITPSSLRPASRPYSPTTQQMTCMGRQGWVEAWCRLDADIELHKQLKQEEKALRTVVLATDACELASSGTVTPPNHLCIAPARSP